MTIILFPDGNNKVIQFRLPKFLLVILILLLASSTASFIWILRDYFTAKTQMPVLAQYKKESERQKKQFVYLSERINQMHEEITELQDFDTRLKVMVNLKTSSDHTQLQGMGGSDSDHFRPDTSFTKNHGELIKSLHQSLENLYEEIALVRQDKTEIHQFLENQTMV